MLCCVEHQLFLSHGLRSAPGDNYVPQHFACLQSSTVGSSNEEGLSDKERLMLQLESGQVYTEGIRVRRRRPCIESTVAVLLQGKQESRGRTHTHKFHICKYIHIYTNTHIFFNFHKLILIITCMHVCTQSCPILCNLLAHKTPLSIVFSRQEYWSGLPFPFPGDLSDPGIEPTSLESPAMAGRFFTNHATWEAHIIV